MNNYISKFDDKSLTGEEIIALMYDNTDENGKLYIPDYSGTAADYGMSDISLVMDWEERDDTEHALRIYHEILNAIDTVAPMAKDWEDFEKNYEAIEDKLGDTQGGFIRNFNLSIFVADFLEPFKYEIQDGYEFGKLKVEEKSIHLKSDEELINHSEYMGYFDDGTDLSSTPAWSDENNGIYMNIPEIEGNECSQWTNNGKTNFLENFSKERKWQATTRVRFGECLSDTDIQLITYARILLKDKIEKESKHISDEQLLQDERNLATVFAIARFAKKMDLADASYRENIENFEKLSDEEQDAYFSKFDRKDIGKASSMSPAYCLAILQDCSSFDHPMSKEEVYKVAKERYEDVPVMRTIERNLLNLSNRAGMGVNYIEGKGYWYEKPPFNVDMHDPNGR